MHEPVSHKQPLLEVACFNVESALIAAEAGADRIELCRDYASGGLSPYPETLTALKSAISIPIYVMVRPHAKHFCYNSEDYEKMKIMINTFKKQGADGFVFGILNHSPDLEGHLEVDAPRSKALVELAGGRPCTFHRAFDLIPDCHWDRALGAIIDCGFQSILTSGGPSGNSAVECTGHLRCLVHNELRKGVSITHNRARLPEIVVGGSVRSTNVAKILHETHATTFHSAALAQASEVVSSDEVRALKVVLDQLTPQNFRHAC